MLAHSIVGAHWTMVLIDDFCVVLLFLNRYYPVLDFSTILYSGNWKDLKDGTCGISFNTDGISPFKSSNTTIWPVIISLSALLPRVQWNKDSLVVVSIWVGQKSLQ